jgi:hypothetical protein
MTYKITTKNDKLEISLVQNELVTKVVQPEYKVSLARTGGQGAKGDTITSAYINSSNHLIIVVLTSSGQTVVNDVGEVGIATNLDGITDVTITDLADKDYIAYEASTQQYKNYKLTTTRMLDVNNTARADGSVLVYNGITQQYTATNTVNNPNLIIVGGTF